jgi:hypothetical protein
MPLRGSILDAFPKTGAAPNAFNKMDVLQKESRLAYGFSRLEEALDYSSLYT